MKMLRNFFYLSLLLCGCSEQENPAIDQSKGSEIEQPPVAKDEDKSITKDLNASKTALPDSDEKTVIAGEGNNGGDITKHLIHGQMFIAQKNAENKELGGRQVYVVDAKNTKKILNESQKYLEQLLAEVKPDTNFNQLLMRHRGKLFRDIIRLVPFKTVTTDSNGRFVFYAPSEKFLVTASTNRSLPDGTKEYYHWFELHDLKEIGPAGISLNHSNVRHETASVGTGSVIAIEKIFNNRQAHAIQVRAEAIRAEKLKQLAAMQEERLRNEKARIAFLQKDYPGIKLFESFEKYAGRMQNTRPTLRVAESLLKYESRMAVREQERPGIHPTETHESYASRMQTKYPLLGANQTVPEYLKNKENMANSNASELNAFRQKHSKELAAFRDAFQKRRPANIPLTGTEIRFVQRGSFTMGSPKTEKSRKEDENPRKVNIPHNFWLGTYELTQSEWVRIMTTNPCLTKNPKAPVENLSWNQAAEFCKQLSKMEHRLGSIPANLVYRLPSEAEWEYACRAGTTTATAFGNSLNSTQANFNGNTPYGKFVLGVDRRQTLPVGSFKANPWGFHDMHGNVWEWCMDRYAKTNELIYRGGSYVSRGLSCRSANKSKKAPTFHRADVGFRLALGVPIGK